MRTLRGPVGVVIAVALATGYGVGLAAERSVEGDRGRRVGEARFAGGVVRVESVEADATETAGFRVEIINPNRDRDLVLLLRKGVACDVDVRLTDSDGRGFSPFRGQEETARAAAAATPSYIRLPPFATYSRFAGIPSVVYADPEERGGRRTLTRRSAGRYVAAVRVTARVGLLPRDERDPAKAVLKRIRVVSPRLVVLAGPETLPEEIVARCYVGVVGKPISSARALEIARERIRGRADYDKRKPAQVRRLRGCYRVTFPFDLPKGALGPDYAARVTVDAETGEILQMLGGS